jgi:hypothetical protein
MNRHYGVLLIAFSVKMNLKVIDASFNNNNNPPYLSPLRDSLSTYVMISVNTSIHYLSLSASRGIPRT